MQTVPLLCNSALLPMIDVAVPLTAAKQHSTLPSRAATTTTPRCSPENDPDAAAVETIRCVRIDMTDKRLRGLALACDLQLACRNER